jgi:beta-lactamase regulating signal transducer with metallopeptidase domain
MNAELFADWLLRSLVTGAVATVLVRLCPVSWRGRFRLVVPVVAFGALIVLAFGLVRPLPRLEIATPVSLAQAQITWNPGTWVVGLWMAGAALFFLRQLFGFRAITQLLRSTHPVPGRIWRQTLAECQRTLGLRGRVRLRLAGPEFVPSATGLFRRTVLLPDEALGWTPEQRRLVLLHELGHFQRGDLWTDALGRLACALHWFNPFAWMLQRQLAVEREYACDALVVQKGARPQDYATLLWQMATASRRRPSSSAAFLAMASPRMGKLEQRVRRILDSGKRAGHWLRVADGGLCVLLAVAMVACTACKPVARMISAVGNGWTPGEIQKRLMADPFPDSR